MMESGMDIILCIVFKYENFHKSSKNCSIKYKKSRHHQSEVGILFWNYFLPTIFSTQTRAFTNASTHGVIWSLFLRSAG